MITYFNQEYVQVFYDDDKKLGKAVWNGFLNSEEFRAASNACLNAIEEYQLLYWLADNRKMKAIRQHDQEWFIQQIVPRLAKSSLRKMATLVSEDLFNQMAIESLELKANDLVGFNNYHFKSEAAALAWLAETASENSVQV